MSSCGAPSSSCPRWPTRIPADVREAEALTDRDQALRWIHFPADQAELETARERLKFDELFTLELGVGFRRRRRAAERSGIAHDTTGPLLDAFARSLPFTPTDAQRRAIEEVDRRMAAPQPMNLLLQGDVGSGKTLVAVHACLVAIASGHQAAIMAPTEVLAGQHLRSATALLGGDRRRAVPRAPARSDRPRGPCSGEAAAAAPSMTYALLSGSVTGADRERIVKGAADGSLDLVIGTHALVQEGVTFADLSLAVVDEQHRFGLHQRIALTGKGAGDVDVLIMTATPIPRTLALTYYGDLDVAVIDELPAGRQPVRTIAARTAAGSRRRRGRWCATRSRPATRRSSCAPRSTRATGPRCVPPRRRPSACAPTSSPSSRWRCCTGGCVRRRRSAPWSASARARPTC